MLTYYGQGVKIKIQILAWYTLSTILRIKQDSQLNSLALVTVWRVVIEKSVTYSQLNSSAFGHCVACCYWKGCIVSL